jgi:hypothetical protein
MNDERQHRADSRELEPARQNDRTATQRRLVPTGERSGSKIRATFHISAELLNELRDVVVALSGPPDRLTLSDLAEGALRREVDRLKRIHMKGKDFAKRKSELKGGRPIR